MINAQLQQILDDEILRQQNGLELIPSENYVSPDVAQALGTVFTNKYSEGYPGKRYYGGQENTDKIETIAIDTAKRLFKADHANVQSHSGAQANEAVYHAWLEPGDTVLAMDLSHGGHLTHGHPVTKLAQQYNFVRYGIANLETGELDYEQIDKLAEEHKPKILLAGFSAYPRTLDYKKFAEIGQKHGCMLMADMAHIAGLIAAGVLANPLEAGFHIMTTTTHKTLRGPRGGMILSMGQVGNPLKAPDKTLENLPTLIDRMVFPGIQGGPHMNTIFAKAVAFDEAERPEFKVYAQTVLDNAKELADQFQQLGLKLVTNGTDNHLILIDAVTSFDCDGAEAELALDAVGLNVNKNVIPDDVNTAYKPSGIRLGTPAITTRGLKPKDMAQVASWIVLAIEARDNKEALAAIKADVENFCSNLPTFVW